MAAELGDCMRRLVLFAIVSVVLLLACRGATRSSSQSDRTDALGANAACYVCHMTFVKEQLSKDHLAAKVTCVKCHGLSAGHANDEDIGATPPDITFERSGVEQMCLTCHKKHDISEKDLAAAGPDPVCTDCHGTHRIAREVAKNGLRKGVPL